MLVTQSCLTFCNQAPLSLKFSRQEYWSELPFPYPGNLPTQESNPGLLHCRQILYCLSHQGSPFKLKILQKKKKKSWKLLFFLEKQERFRARVATSNRPVKAAPFRGAYRFQRSQSTPPSPTCHLLGLTLPVRHLHTLDKQSTGFS